MFAHISPLALIALICGSLAALLLIGYLIKRPALDGVAKIWLLFAFAVFPLGLAMAGNVQGLESSKQREFCGSCHVMTPYTDDAGNPRSGSLASRHSRNALFGEQSCYMCHADYGMFGTVVTKMGGLGHVYRYYGEYRTVSLAEARERIHLRKPYDNANCMQCHSTETTLWLSHPDHRAVAQDVRERRISCASAGCHGFAHPFSKVPFGSPAPASTP